MPKINVYLPDDLAEAVRDAGIPVSPLCQQVLQQAVRRVGAIREVARGNLDPAVDPAGRLIGFTDRACYAIRTAVRSARSGGASAVGTGHLVDGLIAEGGNLALLILRSLEIDPAQVGRDLADRAASPAGTEPHADSGWRFSDPAAEALQLAVSESFALGHNFVGCEHLLLGLVAEPNGAAGQALRALGAEQRVTRRAASTALHGFVHARNQAQSPPASAPGASDLTAVIHHELRPVTERLDRLEQSMAALTGGEQVH